MVLTEYDHIPTGGEDESIFQAIRSIFYRLKQLKRNKIERIRKYIITFSSVSGKLKR